MIVNIKHLPAELYSHMERADAFTWKAIHASSVPMQDAGLHHLWGNA